MNVKMEEFKKNFDNKEEKAFHKWLDSTRWLGKSEREGK